MELRYLVRLQLSPCVYQGEETSTYALLSNHMAQRNTLMPLELDELRISISQPRLRSRQNATKLGGFGKVILLVGIFVLSLGIVTLGYLFKANQEEHFRQEKFSQLLSIANLKVQEIVDWRNQRLIDSRFFGNSKLFSHAIVKWMKTRDPETRELILDSWNTLSLYSDVQLVDTQGTILLSRLGEADDIDPEGLATIKAVIATRSPLLRDLHVKGSHSIQMELISPIMEGDGDDSKVAALICYVIDPNTTLFPMIKAWPVESRTAETLLVRREGNSVRYLNDLRHTQNSALNLFVPMSEIEVPAVVGLLGRKGIFQGKDYRGETVLAALSNVPDSPWVVVAKEDLSEAFQVLYSRNNLILAVIVLLLLSLGLATSISWSRVSRSHQHAIDEARAKSGALISHFDYLQKYVSDMITLTDEELRIIEANDRALKAFGFEREELVTKKITELIHPDSLPEFLDQLLVSSPSGVFQCETIMLRKDGSSFPAEIDSRFIKVNDRHYNQQISRDITNKQRAEAELLRAQKLESLSLLAGGIAHDFNNLLSGVFGYIDMAREHARAQRIENVLSCLDKCLSVFGRAKDLTRQLLTFSKGGIPEKKPGDLGKLLLETVPFSLSGSSLTASFDIVPDLWSCQFDAGQISQVIENIVINAKHAMANGGEIKVTVKNICCNGSPLLTPYVVAPPGASLFDCNTEIGDKTQRPYVKVSIQDFGVGIPPENLQRIFDPFFSTKHGGSGLGLATSYSIIKKHEGVIQVDSEQGIGTVFNFFIPASGTTIPAPVSTSFKPSSGSARILVMDDETYILDVVSQMLERLGYDVQVASTGENALSYFRAAQALGTPFDLVLLDLTVPGGLGGKATLELLRDIDPNIRAVASSGYSDDPVMARPKDFGFHSTINKPYVQKELAHVIEAALI